MGALLLGLFHLVRHLRKKKICLPFNISILTQHFTLVANVLIDGDVHLGGAKEEQNEEQYWAGRRK